jgi:hypothetical protein
LPAILGIALTTGLSAQTPLRPFAGAVAAAPPGLMERLRADPFTYFRCEVFADVPHPTIVRLHGDAHVEQFALTNDAWGLDDFDDSSRGPAFVDIVRFLGSIDLATRQRNWTSERDALWTRFFEGYRRGLRDPDYRPAEPELVRELRKHAPASRASHLAWGVAQMQPMDEERLKAVAQAMEFLDGLLRRERPELAPRYLAVVRAGWLHLGVGSAAARKVLIRVEGPTADPEDDVLLEAKEVTNLENLSRFDDSATPQAVRVISGALQLGRLKHDILAVGPTMLIPTAADRGEHWLDWWVSSWEPSYREVHLSDLRSSQDLGDIAFDAGVQLGSAKVVSVRHEALSAVEQLEGRLRKETGRIVEELLAGWRELRGR